MSLDLTDAVLLLVDLQQAFDGPPWPRRWNSDLDGNGQALLAAWRQAALPLIHVRHDSAAPNSSLRPGRPGNRFRQGFEPRDGEAAVAKSVNSAFIATDLDLRLRRLGAKRVVAFGISTDMCVSTTIRTGANLGWPMVLVADACDCFDLPDGSGGTIPAETVQAVHVATLGFEFCTVVSTRQVLAALGSEPTMVAMESLG
ncbi:cysteine hydrolase [Bosea caraganae]|uniref:Cysteine hydrolase n=1 Tax=Bosea caraganae TaxID=2763117 RepID=A0A370L2E8_9HYPH|nr:cysteine hydrolase family protein [Bosea caraganae]RDJ22433.1 cysteine hydrolase [Bosea caraganae]RDJ30392.1 cysteine hydrolase [Bosea caraganae]